MEKYFKLGDVLKEKDYLLRSVEINKYIPMFLETDLTRPQIELFLFSLIYGGANIEDLIDKYNLEDELFVHEFINLFIRVKNECLNAGIDETNLKCFLHANIYQALLFEFL